MQWEPCVNNARAENPSILFSLCLFTTPLPPTNVVTVPVCYHNLASDKQIHLMMAASFSHTYNLNQNSSSGKRRGKNAAGRKWIPSLTRNGCVAPISQNILKCPPIEFKVTTRWLLFNVDYYYYCFLVLACCDLLFIPLEPLRADWFRPQMTYVCFKQSHNTRPHFTFNQLPQVIQPQLKVTATIHLPPLLCIKVQAAAVALPLALAKVKRLINWKQLGQTASPCTDTVHGKERARQIH